MAGGHKPKWEVTVPYQIRGYYLGYNVVTVSCRKERHMSELNIFLSDYKMWENKIY